MSEASGCERCGSREGPLHYLDGKRNRPPLGFPYKMHILKTSLLAIITLEESRYRLAWVLT